MQSKSNLPAAYQVAIEVLLSHGDVSQSRLNGLCNDYAKTYGVLQSPDHSHHVECAWNVVRQQFPHRVAK